MPKRLITTYRGVTGGAVVLAFYFLGYFLFGPDPVRIVFGSLLIGSLVTVTYILTGPAVQAIRRGIQDGGDNIIVSQWGIFGLRLGYFVWIQYVTAARLSAPTPEEAIAVSQFYRNLPVNGMFTALFFVATAYTILAPINTKLTIEKPSLRVWLAGVIAGTVIATVLATLSFLGIVNYFS